MEKGLQFLIPSALFAHLVGESGRPPFLSSLFLFFLYFIVFVLSIELRALHMEDKCPSS